MIEFFFYQSPFLINKKENYITVQARRGYSCVICVDALTLDSIKYFQSNCEG